MILSLLLGIFNISPSAVLSLAGAFIGYYYLVLINYKNKDFYLYILYQYICIYFAFINKIFS